ADTVGSVFVPIEPCRVADTRNSSDPIANREVRTFQISGDGPGFAAQGGTSGGCAIPTAATAVEASISAVTPSAPGFFRAWPTGGAPAAATFLNYSRAQGITNTGTIALGTGPDDLTTQNYGPTTRFVIDTQGYYIDPADLPAEYDNAVTVDLHWQTEFSEDLGHFGAVDDYAAYHLPDDATGQVTLMWNDGGTVLATEGDVQVTSRV